MRLNTLLRGFISIPKEADVEVARMVIDSRLVQAGDLFVALKGTQSDGRQYVESAIQKGATAVLIDSDGEKASIAPNQPVPTISLPGLRATLGRLAAIFYDEPSKEVNIIGVTGTNGKTSTTHFIAQALGQPCGVIGTLGNGIYGQLGEPGLTTPDAITLQALLREFKTKNVNTIAMEVSSHSIDQGRVNGTEFEIAVFTNLTQDHLDYHHTMEAYANVKRRFLSDFPAKHVVINADDEYGKKWITELFPRKSVFAYSTQAPSALNLGQVPLVYVENIQLNDDGIHARVVSPWGEGDLFAPLIGQFNLSNVLAVLTSLCVQGVTFQDALVRIRSLRPVDGRMQSLGGVEKPRVVVDYAHTPDALEKALLALRPHTKGRLICVFGCGGDRDAGKRPLMAKIAEHLADQVIVTTDNPRHEKPEAITAQIVAGLVHPDRIEVMLDRSKAIKNSIQCAKAGDCILIAGKGAERYQQVGDVKHPFDDVEQAQNSLNDANFQCDGVS